MAQLAPFFRTVFTEVDGDGNVIPLAGGKLFTYVSGTTTDKATYTDQGGLTANANPIILDAAGGCDLWLDTTGAYTLVLKDSDDATIDTWDAVSAVPAAVTGSYLPLAGGTVTGAITLAGNATANLHAVPLQQANSLIAAAIATEVTNRNSAIDAVAMPDQSSSAGLWLRTDGTDPYWYDSSRSSYRLATNGGGAASRTVRLVAGEWTLCLQTIVELEFVVETTISTWTQSARVVNATGTPVTVGTDAMTTISARANLSLHGQGMNVVTINVPTTGNYNIIVDVPVMVLAGGVNYTFKGSIVTLDRTLGD